MKKTKKPFLALLCCMMLCMMAIPGHIVLAAPDIKIVINGQEISFPDQKPYIDSANRTMVPVRAPMEAIGCTVEWDADKQQAIISKQGVVAVFTIGSSTYTVNGEEKTMDTQAVIVGGRTAFPIRFAAEAMGATVGWDAATYTVTVIVTDTDIDSVQTIEFEPTDPAGLTEKINVAGYELEIANGPGTATKKGPFIYITSRTRDLFKVVCDKPEWNEYNAPKPDGSYGIVRLDGWKNWYQLPWNISPAPKAGDQITLNIYGKVNGQETKLVTIIKYF